MGKLNRISLSIVLLVLLIGIVISARYLLSALALIEVREEISIWSKNNTVTSLGDWDRAYGLLQKTIRLRPSEADAYNILGNLYEWQGFSIEGDRPKRKERSKRRSNAIQAYRTATSLHPAWPLVWAHFAMLKSTAGEWDEEFDRALLAAISLGKNDPSVQKEVTDIATSLTWAYINNEPFLREQVISTIVQGLVSLEDRRARINLLSGKSLLKVICPELKHESMELIEQKLCKNYSQ